MKNPFKDPKFKGTLLPLVVLFVGTVLTTWLVYEHYTAWAVLSGAVFITSAIILNRLKW
jgi:preprotein translocase subunit SecY